MIQQYPTLFNERDAARMLAVSVAALRRWRRERRGPRATYIERCVRYELRELQRYLAEHSAQRVDLTTEAV